MILRVYRAELYKIIASHRFKIALVAILIFSICNIVIEYRKFPNYGHIYENNKKENTNRINTYKKYLEELNSETISSLSCYFNQSEDVINHDKRIYEKEIEFFSNHETLQLRKDFSQGLVNSIFDDVYWLPILLLFCCDIVCSEKSKNIMQMQFSSRISRYQLYHSKYMAILTAMILIFILNLIFSYFFSGCLMGFSDLSGSMRSISGYSTAIIERSVKELLALKVIFGIIICASAAVIFIFISTVSRDFITSYIISFLLVASAGTFYFMIKNGVGFSKYFFISFYYANETYITGDVTYNIKFGLISMLVQNIFLYLLGLYIYKKIE